MAEVPNQPASPLRILALIAALAVGVWFVIAYFSGGPAGGDGRSCLDRGEFYYRDIGSWPSLSDGRDAMAVIRERCGRSSSAF